MDIGVSEEKQEDPQPGTSADMNSNWGTSERKVQICPFVVAASDVNRSEAISVNKDSTPLSVLMLSNKTNR